MRLGEVIYESGSKLNHAYFPVTSMVSLHYVMEMVLLQKLPALATKVLLARALFMGGNTTTSLATVYTAGYGYRLKAGLLMDEFNQAGPFMQILLRYTPGTNDTHWRRQPPATGTIPLNSNYAVGFIYAGQDCRQ